MANKDIPNLKDVSRVPEELLPVLHWWQDRGPKTLAYVAVVTVAVGAGLLFYTQRQTKRAEAIVALSGAVQPEDFEGILEKSTSVDDAAGLGLARALFAAGDYEGALAAYGNVEDASPETPFAELAAFGKIATLEALARFDEAEGALAAFESAMPDFLKVDATLLKARLQCQKGDKALAKETLQPLLTATEETVQALAKRHEQMIDSYVPGSAEVVLPVALPEEVPTAETVVPAETASEVVEAKAPEATPALPGPEGAPATSDATAEAPAEPTQVPAND